MKQHFQRSCASTELKSNKEAIWLYAELFLGISDNQKFQSICHRASRHLDRVLDQGTDIKIIIRTAFIAHQYQRYTQW